MLPEPHHYHSYTDETCQTGHVYMVIGGVICRPEMASQLASEIQCVKHRFTAPGPVKWNKIKRTKLPRYKAILDCFFRHNCEHRVDFSAIVVNCSKLNHKKYNRGVADIGYSKFVFQHLLKHSRKYDHCGRFYCTLDQRDTNHDLDEIRGMLNAKAATHYSDIIPRYKLLRFRPSPDEPLLQLSDILIGAVGHCMNEKGTKIKNPYKSELAEYIRRSAGLASLTKQTPYNDRHFDIWHFRGRDWD